MKLQDLVKNEAYSRRDSPEYKAMLATYGINVN
jgi:hypothetical protein